MIAIVNYDTGNIRSVTNALGRVGCTEWIYTDDKAVIATADKVILPGVGEASTAMAKLAERGLDTFIPTLTQPVLGICVGTQLMCQSSEEGNVQGMGIFRTRVRRFAVHRSATQEVAADVSLSPDPSGTGMPAVEKIPHMGWNRIVCLRSPLFSGVGEGSYIYYVHSYYPELCDDTIAVTTHINPFSGALGRDNFFGTQFHPEKSGAVGAQILKNFLEL